MNVFICLQLCLKSLIHEYFTSHTKVYLVVRYRSEITVRFYLVIIKVMLSVIYRNEYQSSRMDLLPLVSHTPERLPLSVTENVIYLYSKYANLDITVIPMPFSCKACSFVRLGIYCVKIISCQHHVTYIIMSYSVFNKCFSKNINPTQYCYRRHG